MIIDRFHANYVISKDRGDPSAVQRRLDHIVSGLLEKEVEPLLPQMGLPEEPLVFIKHISLDLVFNLSKPDEHHNDRDCARLWAKQMIEAIKKSLARMPTSYTLPDAGDNIVMFPNRAVYLARFFHDLSTGGDPRNLWYYREFKDLDSLSPREIVKLLCQQNREFLEAILLDLKYTDGLFKTLEILTEDDARFIFDLLPGEPPGETAMAIDTTGSAYHEILGFIKKILEKSEAGFTLAYGGKNTYKLSLLLYLEYLSRGNQNPVPGIDAQYRGPASKAWIKKAIETIVIKKPESLREPGTGKSPKAGAITKLKTAYGGLFLLIPAMVENRFIENITQISLPDIKEIPALNGFLYLMAVGLARQNAEYPALVERDDPGFYVFAGLDPGVNVPPSYFEDYEKSLNPAAIIQWLATDEHRQTGTPAASVPSVPSVPSVANQKQNIDLESVLVEVNEGLLRLFAKRLAGFEKSGPSYLFTHFIRRNSELTVTDDKIQVNLSAKPLDTVLRLSGLLEETPRVPWWGNKTLTLHLRGE